MPERTGAGNRHPLRGGSVHHSSTPPASAVDCVESFRGELHGDAFRITVKDFIVRDDHVAVDFLVHEPGYEDSKVEGNLRELTDESFARAGRAKYGGVVQYIYGGQRYLITLRLETECIGMMTVTGEWHHLDGEVYDFSGDLEPVA